MTAAQLGQLRAFFHLRKVLFDAREKFAQSDAGPQMDDGQGERLAELFEKALHRNCSGRI